MKHETYTITISFTVCEGQKDKVLEEIREIMAHVEKKSLDHASDKKVKVTHEPLLEKTNNE